MKTAKKDTTRELPDLPKPRGGWREGAGRKKVDYETKAMRVDVRLIAMVETLKEKLKSGEIDETKIKILTELVA